ncbi:hypothetical protein DFJ77DRAFT_512018 [Powellomyces hirtus]|nr:hypothetical protein DFJ77DRAFT_512018 [Powellomyces hirtus]
MAIPRTATIDIPIGQIGEVLEVSRQDLGENEVFVFNILNEEAVPLWVYLDIALEYWKQGLERQFEEAIRSGLRRAKKAPDPSEKRHHVLLLNLLASFFIEKLKLNAESGIAPDASHAAELEATALLNEALAMASTDVYTIVASANIRIARREYDEASRAFEGALHHGPNCIPALLGQARFYRKALEMYQKVLRLKPDIQPDVRVPIGICYYQLGAPTQARKAFSRALEQDPENLDAMMLLSIMDWNHCRHSEADLDVITAMSLKSNAALSKVYLQDSTHPLLLIQMAERKLLQNDYAKASEYADRVLQYSSTERLRSEALFCKGKALQAQRHYKDALACFVEAGKLNPAALPVQYSIASLHISQGQIELACQGLEAILLKEPDNVDILVQLASLYAPSASHQERATELFALALKHESKGSTEPGQQSALMEDAHTLLDMARASEQTNMKKSLQLHVQALKSLHEKSQPILAELYNNIGAMCLMLGERDTATGPGTVLAEAKNYSDCAANEDPDSIAEAMHSNGDGSLFRVDLLETILDNDTYWCKENLLFVAGEILNYGIARCKEAGDVSMQNSNAMTKVTLTYNMARVRESLGHTNRAIKLYKRILQEHPAYVDSHLRLGIIYLQQGQFDDAIEQFRLVADIDPKNKEARLHLGRAYMMADKKIEAKRTFDSVLKTIDNQNIPALVALAHVQLGLARAARHDPKEREDWILRGHRLYDAVLKADNQNVPAAIGMGIILAESGFLADAKSVFSQVEQATGNNAAVAMNLAHVLLAADERDAKVAIPLYEKALKKGYGKDPYVLAALSRAYYILARERKDDSSMKRSLLCIEQAVKINPSDSAMIFNLALVKQQMAGVLNDQPIEKRNLNAMHAAKEGIKTAERLLIALAARTPESRPNYSLEHATLRRDYCADVRKLSEKKIHETTTLERQREERKEMIREEQKAREEEKRRKEEEENGIRKEREERLAIQRMEEQARVQANEASSQQHDESLKEEEGRKKPKGSKRTREAMADGDADGPDAPRDGKRKLVRKKSIAAKGATDPERGGRGRARGVQSQLSAEFILDSDESDSADEGNGTKQESTSNGQSSLEERRNSISEDEDVRPRPTKIKRPAFDSDSDDDVRDPDDA